MNFRLTPDQEELMRRADELGRTRFAPLASRWDETREYPWDNIPLLLENGFFGLTMPREYGGQGRPLLDAVLVIEQVAKYCGVTARLVVETNTGAIGCIMAYGTDEQRRLVAERILKGDKPAIGMTEPDAGTDLTRLQTTAVQKGDQWIVNGRKHWITGGGIAESNLIFARMIRSDGTDCGIGALLVDKGTPGFTCGRVENAMGLRGIPEAELIFEDCAVPDDRVVVLEHGLEGFKKLMMGYNAQRVGASAVALGIAQGAFDLAVAYMKERHAFGRPLSDFQGLQWMMAESAIKLQAARLLLYRAAANARLMPNNAMFPDPAEAAMAKAYTAKIAFEVTSDALQMFGARGYAKDLPLERMLRDVRAFQISGGSTQAQYTAIARALFPRRKRADS